MKDARRVDGALIRVADVMATLLVGKEYSSETCNIYHSPVVI
jgi:hypothetical protein